MNRAEHHARVRTLLAYLADTAVSTETALGYEGVLLELDRLVDPGDLAPTIRWSGNSRHDAHATAHDHLAALTEGDEPEFQVALCRAELDVVWQQEQTG